MTAVTEAPVIGAQQARCKALASILGIPGLATACWTIDGETEVGFWPGLTGQLAGEVPLDAARAAIAAYAFELDIQMLPEKDLPNFRSIRAQGEYMGVVVRVWAAAVRPAVTA